MRDWLRLLLAPKEGVMGMNRRNLDWVRTRNRRRDYGIADDKLRAKALLREVGVPVPDTLTTFRTFHELGALDERLAGLDEFVVKPSRGHGGLGVLVVAGRTEEGFRTAGGRLLDRDQLRRHVADIIFGVYTLDRPDVAIVEPRLRPHAFFEALFAEGLSDLRIIMVDDRAVAAMIRVPTRASDGRANLHQGGLGLGVRLEDGLVHRAWHQGRTVEIHPDTGAPLLGATVPYWPRILQIADDVARALPLKYLGLDVVVDPERGPQVLEVNVRPGLEIQNVTGMPLRERLRAMGVTP